jgi:hypothetical protein
MPVLVQLAAIFAAIWAAIALLVLALLFAMAVSGTGTFEWNGAPVSREEFLRHLPLLALGLGVPAVYLGTVALGVRRERAWVRPAVVALWLAVSALLIGQGIVGAMGLATALLWSAVYIGFVGWYFYAKANVVAYYRVLEAWERQAASPTSADQQAAV